MEYPEKICMNTERGCKFHTQRAGNTYLLVNANGVLLKTANHATATEYLQHADKNKGFAYCAGKHYNVCCK